MARINLGILSTAGITERAILNPSKTLPEIAIMAVASRDLVKAKEYATKHQIPKFYGSYDELLKDPAINIIYNPLPNGLHAEWSIKALQAGKHVLCEKPIASNASDAIRMKEVADETGLYLVEAFHNRYHPATMRIKEIIDSNLLGKLQQLEAHFCFGGISRNNIRCSYELAGGSFMDLGCYPLNLFRYFCNEEPIVISSKARCEIDQIDDTMEVELRFPSSEVTAKITCSMMAEKSNHSLQVTGSLGRLECVNPFVPKNQQLLMKIGKKKKKENFKAKISYEYQLKALINAITDNKPMFTTIEDGIANMIIIDEIYEKAGLKIRTSPDF
jgi:predicted dehydrogenase